MMTEGYHFIFQMIDYDTAFDDQEYTLQYRFTSVKSHHKYIVRVERYRGHAYCLKFFDKANINSKNKYSLRTNTFEARTIFYTLYHIMLDVLRRDSRASFFFIGAEDEKDELGKSTRRYRIYRIFVSTIISDNKFEHFRDNNLSLYVLVNKAAVEAPKDYANKIMEKVKQAYNH